MFKGLSTDQAYEKCLTLGLCERHLKELNKEQDIKERYELQRKAFLFIRLRVLDPILFGKPYIFEKMKALVSKSSHFTVCNLTSEQDLGGERNFLQSVILLDSIVVFTLCQFCKLCCSGCLFLNSQKFECGLHPEADFIYKLLNNKNVTESDISHFNPILQNNFNGNDTSFIKFCYVVALLFVRNTTIRTRLDDSLIKLSAELKNVSKESEKWIEIAEEAHRNENFEEALMAYASALKYNPYCVSGRKGRALAYIKTNNFKLAQLDSYIALMIDPQHCTAYPILALSQLKQSLFGDAMKTVSYGLQKCKTSHPGAYEELLKMEQTIREKTQTLNRPLNGACQHLEDGSHESIPQESKSLKSELNNGTKAAIPIRETNMSARDTTKEKEHCAKVEDLPDLEEAPDSENDFEDYQETPKAAPVTRKAIPDVPDLSDASKSDDSDCDTKDNKLNGAELNKKATEPKIAVKNSAKKRSRSNSACLSGENIEKDKAKNQSFEGKIIHPELNEEEKKIKRKELSMSLKEGSQTLLDGCGLVAVRLFHEVLDTIKNVPQVYKLEECQLVCIKYAYALAYCTSGGYEDLQKSIAVFKEIIEDHSSVTFPAVYYGIGLAFYKLNRFKDALTYLKIVEDILGKRIHFKVYVWPELNTVINETKFEQLQELTEKLIKSCETPPVPDATCRLKDCCFQPSIYYTDPDFKGYYSLQCSEHCSLQYHPQCWKVLKHEKQYTDKEFLEQMCLTPDCDGTITKVESTNKEGNMGKMFGNLPVKKPTKSKKPKVLKKLDIKEEKKRKQKNSRELETDKHRNLQENSPTPPLELNEGDTPPKDTSLKPDIETVDSTVKECEKENSKSYLPLSVDAEPFKVIRKDKTIIENSNKALPKVKESKRSRANTISFDEFCKTEPSSNEFPMPLPQVQQKNQCLAQEEWPTCDETFGNIHSVESFEAINNTTDVPHTNHQSDYVDTFGEISDFDAIQSNLYNYMEDLLNKSGPLSVKDPVLVGELETFPTEANVVIAKYGGIAEFLKSDNEYRFGIVDDLFICSRDDLADAYKLSRSSGELTADNLDLQEEFESQKEEVLLNPDAKEYTPSGGSSSSTSFGSCVEQACSEPNLEKVNHNSPSLILAMSKLRQPLAVDEDGIVHCAGDFANKNLGGENVAAYEINDLTQKCIEGIKAYFSETMLPQRCYIDSCIKPYGLVCNAKKSSKCLQTGVEMKSQETMKEDEEFDSLKEMVEVLTAEKRDLSVQRTLMETKLTSQMDSAIKSQKRASVDITNLKKELEDSHLAIESLKKECKDKELKLEREHKLLLESLNKATEENVQHKKESAMLRTTNESLLESFKKFEENSDCLQNENKYLKKSLDQQLEKNTENNKSFENDKLQLTNRAKNAELQFLRFKKDTTIQKIDGKTVEAAKKMKELEQYPHLMLNSNPLWMKTLEALLSQIRNYITKLAEIRLDFQVRMDEQINAVNNGSVLASLSPIEIQLPEIPSFSPQIPIPNVSSANQPPAWKAQGQVVNNTFQSMYQAAHMQNTTNIMNRDFGSNSVPTQPQFPVAAQSQRRVPANVNPQLVPTPSTEQTKSKMPPGIRGANMPSKMPADPVSAEDKSKSSSVTPTMSPAISKDALSEDVSATSLPTQPQVPKVKTKLSDSAAVSPATSMDLSAISKEPLVSRRSSVSGGNQSENASSSPSLELGYNVKKKETADSTSTASLFKSTSMASLSSIQPTTSKTTAPKNSYEKLLQKLKLKFPSYEETQLMSYIKEFRQMRKGGLSGLAIDTIIANVSELIKSKNPSSNTVKADPANKTRSLQNKVLVDKKIATTPKEEPAPESTSAAKSCPWGRSDKNQWSGNAFNEECVICCENMSFRTAYKVDCGHCFHLSCIRTWVNKKSDCPVCRVHLLLPEDYPALP